jgi:NAD(P)-dependent dehydrogenase (short-subunit alcohol dehydrogenase family)
VTYWELKRFIFDFLLFLQIGKWSNSKMVVPCLSLKGRVAVVTGGRRGIGKAIALRFAEAEADVAVCDLVADSELDAVAEKVKQLGRRSLVMQVDVKDKASVNVFVQKVEDVLGGISILANVAGINNVCALADLPEEQWDSTLDTNLKGCYLCCQAVIKRMIKRKSGNIINIASTDGYNPIRSQVAYNCSKIGVRMLTSVLAFELGRYNIRVNAIAPGWILTKMEEYNKIVKVRDLGPHRTTLHAVAEAEIALGRLGEPCEIANVALFLASDLASYVSGATWRVDGALNPLPLSAMPESIALEEL